MNLHDLFGRSWTSRFRLPTRTGVVILVLYAAAVTAAVFLATTGQATPVLWGVISAILLATAMIIWPFWSKRRSSQHAFRKIVRRDQSRTSAGPDPREWDDRDEGLARDLEWLDDHDTAQDDVDTATRTRSREDVVAPFPMVARTLPMSASASRWEDDVFPSLPAWGAPTRRPDERSAMPGAALVAVPAAIADPAETPSSGSRRFWLVPVEPMDAAIELDQTNIRMGSSTRCEIVVAGEQIRSEHCILRWTGRTWEVQAVDQAVIAVNDRPATSAEPRDLRSGDRLKFPGGKVFELLEHHVEITGETLIFDAASATSAGNRTANQDRAAHQHNVLVLADGVQGRPGGSQAADLAIDSIKRQADINPSVGLEYWLTKVTGDFDMAEARNPQLSEMSTTLDVARLNSSAHGIMQVEGLHVGDGNVFVLAGSKWVQMTVPHTVRHEILAAGQVPPETMIGMDSLTLAVTPRRQISGQGWRFDAAPGQRWILCSDGVINALSVGGLERAVRDTRGTAPGPATRAIVNSALSSTAEKDNLTVIVADIVPQHPRAMLM